MGGGNFERADAGGRSGGGGDCRSGVSSAGPVGFKKFYLKNIKKSIAIAGNEDHE